MPSVEIRPTPRPFQVQGVAQVAEAYDKGFQAPMIVAATGVGKTVLACECIRNIFTSNNRTMFLCHRSELVFQFIKSCKEWLNTTPDVEMNTWRADESLFRRSSIVASTVQTQVSGDRMTKFEGIDNLIIDECHHATSRSWVKVVDYYKDQAHAAGKKLRILGLTATPFRSDKQALGEVFDTVAFTFGVSEAVDDGWLVRPLQHLIHVEGIDLRNVRTTAGELNLKQLSEVLEYERVLHGMVNPMLEIAGDRQVLLFGCSIAQIKRVSEIINRHRPGAARWVTGDTPGAERIMLNRDFADKRFQILCNVGTHTEGYDNPGIEVICQMRPLKSRVLWQQTIGRGLRPLEGVVDQPGIVCSTARKAAISQSAKPHCQIIDYYGNSGRHHLCTSVDIFAGKYGNNEEVKARALSKIREGGGLLDTEEAIDEAAKEIQGEKDRQSKIDEERRKEIRAKVTWSSQEMSAFRLVNVTPERRASVRATAEPITDKQADYLKKSFKVEDTRGWTKKEAGMVIGRLSERRKQGLCSTGQAKLISKFGYDPVGISIKDASKLIDEIKSNGWKRPGWVQQ